MYDESWSGISGGFPPCARALSIASSASRPSGAPTDTTSAPVLLNSERRENEAGFSNFVMAASPSTHHRGGALDRLQDADMRATSALETFERLLDLGFRR